MRIFLCAILFLLANSLPAQYNFSSLDQWLKDNNTNLGGRAVLLIYKDGKIIYQKSYNNLTPRQRMARKIIARRQGTNPSDLLQDFNEHTQQPIASCSKWLSAALVMTFVDEGKLRVEDTVGKFLPVMTKHGKGNITIAQCLAHLTGIKQIGLDAAIDSIARMAMEGEPGKTFHYGNAGLQIAAAVIEKISGKDFESLFQERIAQPCEMINTTFGSDKVPLAAGGAKGTASDYLHFLQMILHKGVYNGKRVLSENSIANMQVNHATNARIVYSPATGANWGYGYGEWVMKEAPHGGVTSPGLFGSFPWVDYEKGYAAMLFTVNLQNKQRAALYKSLKEAVDKSLIQ